jgi:DNA-binding FrmR family transcriptional regulator
MKHDVHHAHREEVINRLAKIEGHIKAIKKMLEDDKPCDQVIIQMAAVKAAMSGATRLLLEDHFDHCIIARNSDDELAEELNEFRSLLGELAK